MVCEHLLCRQFWAQKLWRKLAILSRIEKKTPWVGEVAWWFEAEKQKISFSKTITGSKVARHPVIALSRRIHNRSVTWARRQQMTETSWESEVGSEHTKSLHKEKQQALSERNHLIDLICDSEKYMLEGLSWNSLWTRETAQNRRNKAKSNGLSVGARKECIHCIDAKCSRGWLAKASGICIILSERWYKHLSKGKRTRLVFAFKYVIREKSNGLSVGAKNW